MLKTVKEFALERGVDRDTVTAYLNRHKDLKEQAIYDHATTGRGRNIVLDTESELYEILEKQYPIPKSVIVQEDIEMVKKLATLENELVKAKDEYIKLLEENTSLKVAITQTESVKLIAEQQKQELIEVKERLSNSEQECQAKELQNKTDRLQYEHDLNEKQKEIEDNQRIIDNLKSELEAERNKKWYQKLFK